MKLLIVSLKAETTVNHAPPTGLYQLKGYLGRRGVDCDILDREIDEVSPYLKAAALGEYDVIGFSVSRLWMVSDIKLIWTFREATKHLPLKPVIIAGGQEATISWQLWLEHGVDVIFTGFAEDTLTMFAKGLNTLESRTPIELEQLLKTLDGVAYHSISQGRGVFNPAPPLTREFFSKICYSELMLNDYPIRKYWSKVRSESADLSMGAAEFIIENVRIFTSSHCPRGCGFCNSQAFLPTSQDGKSAIIMLSAEEIGDLVLHYVDKYGARGFLFSDDDFPIGSKLGLERLRNFCRIIIEHKKLSRIPANTRFSCQARILDFMSREVSDGEALTRKVDLPLLKLMAEAGFMSIGMGVETYNDRVLKCPSISKFGTTKQDCIDVIDAMILVGLTPQTNIILGIPDYRVEELEETLETAFESIKKGCDIAVTLTMWALPGAPAMVKHQIYKTTQDTWTNPFNGKIVETLRTFIPEDSKIRDVIGNFENQFKFDLNAIVDRAGWSGKEIIAKKIVEMAKFIAVAKCIGATDLAERFNEYVNYLIYRKSIKGENIDSELGVV